MLVEKRSRWGSSLASLIAMLLLLWLTGCAGSSTPPVPSPTPTPVPTPSFTSAAPPDAAEGEVYSYELAATDPAGGSVTFALQAHPEGATLDGNTISWTPTRAQSRITNRFTVVATGNQGRQATQTFDISPAGTVAGTIINHHIANGALVDVPMDISAAAIEALVPDGEGGLTAIPAVDTGSGTFSIPGVPAGYYWLKANSPTNYPSALVPLADFPEYVRTSASDLDLGRTVQGRPDIAFSQNPKTITFDLSFATPPSEWDHVSLYTPNVGFEVLAQSNDPFEFILGVPIRRVIDASKGDESFAILSSITEPHTVTQVAGPLSISETATDPLTVTAAMQTVTPNLTTHPILRKQEFQDLVTAIIPDAIGGPVLDVRDVAYDGSAGPGYGFPLMQINWSPADPPNGEIDFGEIAFANPFPGHPQFTSAVFTAHEPPPENPESLPLPTSSVSLGWGKMGLPSAEDPIRPQIGPVISPTIDGKTLLQEQQDVSLTPTIAWNRPSLGTPSYYRIFFSTWATWTPDPTPCPGLGCSPSPLPPPPAPLRPFPSAFLTRETQLRIPAGILEPGTEYAVSIVAVYEPGSDVEHAPFRGATETHSASISSKQVKTVAAQPAFRD